MMFFFRTTLTVCVVLSTTAAEACRMKPYPITRQGAEQAGANGQGYAFRGKVLERAVHCDQTNTPTGKAGNLFCRADYRIEIIENFGAALKGTVMLESLMSRLAGCTIIHDVGEEAFFIVSNKDVTQRLVLDTVK